MGYLLDFISILLVVIGLVFFLGAAVGLVRFPDFYTRMHAAGKGDTLSTILILAGLAIFVLNEPLMQWISAVFQSSTNDAGTSELAEDLLVASKIMAIAVFIMLTSPTSTHALMQAGYDDGIKPFERDTEEDDQVS